MTSRTAPVFFVSSGRSGTKMMEKLLASYDEMEMSHEYMVHHIQPIAVRYQLGLANRHEVRHVLTQTHRAAIHYSEKPIWGDSSNKLTWIIDVLAELFHDAKFVHLVRDGRKVASSYFHKLAAECYDDRSTAIMSAYVDQYPAFPAPPPEKRYWWPQPRRGSPQRSAFRTYSQFERIAYHWAEANRMIFAQLAKVPPERQCFLRLEDLTRDPRELQRLTQFIGLAHNPDAFALLAKPHNINQPVDRPLTGEQAAQFEAIAGEMMRALAYAETQEYAVNY